MKNILFAVMAAVLSILLAWFLWAVSPDEEYRVYDCSLAEFHPDYPPAVREECRKIRQQSTKNYI